QHPDETEGEQQRHTENDPRMPSQPPAKGGNNSTTEPSPSDTAAWSRRPTGVPSTTAEHTESTVANRGRSRCLARATSSAPARSPASTVSSAIPADARSDAQ